jgi:hypothetical protein
MSEHKVQLLKTDKPASHVMQAYQRLYNNYFNVFSFTHSTVDVASIDTLVRRRFLGCPPSPHSVHHHAEANWDSRKRSKSFPVQTRKINITVLSLDHGL